MKMGRHIIAEIGSVHDGSFGNAIKLIEAASKCGASSVKFQTHMAEHESLPCAPSPSYFKNEDRMSYFDRTSFSKKQWVEIRKCCHDNGVLFISSSFSIEAFQLLEEIGVDAHKIPSGDVSNLPLLETMSKSDKIIFLSSGMSNWLELDGAFNILKHNNLVIMQCSSIYPCPPNKVGLNVMIEMSERYNCSVGFSDHTDSITAGIAAATLGAQAIEKHFTFSKLMYGSDALHSMEPKDFKTYCDGIIEAWEMCDSVIDKNDITLYKNMKKVFEKSIIINTAKPCGHVITRNDLAFKKCGNGISSFLYQDVVGKKLLKNIDNNHILLSEDFA